ncbi:MAG TPA: hypothetical protein VH120_22025, partial [Gemmataceae bacterium]|nr:hypothetical protein [Gemmataceae bacterium]
MFGTLAAAAALSLTPAQQAASLNLTNARTTYGEMGALRTDNHYLPDDFFFLAFDMEGFVVSPEGKVSYTMMVEVTNKAGQAVFRQDKPADYDQFIVLGGNRLPGRAWVSLKPDQEPGPYTCKVTVTDRVTKASKALEKQFEVVKKDFGLINLMTTFDADGKIPAPPTGVVGQIIYLHGAVVNFGRGQDKKPNTTIELRILDEQRRPTVARPQGVFVPKDIPPAAPPASDAAFIALVIPLNREGNFTGEVKAVDATTG